MCRIEKLGRADAGRSSELPVCMVTLAELGCDVLVFMRPGGLLLPVRLIH